MYTEKMFDWSNNFTSHCTVLSHASIANFSKLDLMCFFEKFRLF